MKPFFFLLLCCVTVLKVAGEETNRFAVDLLEEAFAKSPNITFSATWFEPIEFIDNAGRQQSMAQVVQYAPDGKREYLQLRLESPKYIFTQNAAGFFAAFEDHEFQIQRSMPNIIVDQLFHALTPEELEAAAIDSVSQKFNGMDCWCVTLETPQDDAVLQKLAHKSPDGFQKYREKYIGMRIFRKVFFIEKEHSLIVGRRDYDKDNKLQYQGELQKVNWNPQLEPYETNSSLPVLFSLKDFGKEVQVAALEEAQTQREHFAGLKRLLRNPGTLGICIGVFSVAVLLCAYLLKRYRNRGNA